MIPMIVGIYTYFEMTSFAPNRFKTDTYTVTSPAIPQDFNGVKIAVFSDVYGDLKSLETAVSSLNNASPDIVVFLGNLLSPDNSDEEISEITSLLKEIKAPLGKFAILGNLDIEKYGQIIPILNNSGFRLSQNKVVNVHNYTDTSIQLLFLDETNTEQRIDSVIADFNTELPTLAFTSNPKNIELLGEKKVLLMVGGETLGGKINIPLIGSLVRRNTYTKNTTVNDIPLFLSSGVSTDEPKVRLLSHPNIVVVSLKASD